MRVAVAAAMMSLGARTCSLLAEGRRWKFRIGGRGARHEGERPNVVADGSSWARGTMRPVEPRDVQFFEAPEAWRAWLEAHHADAREVWVGYHKRATGRPSLTWPESVDQALCFGWIDGIRKRI